MKTPKTFYKFRPFSTLSLTSLCEDTLYFSNPGNFNDPLDCSPTIEGDSETSALNMLLSYFINQRVTAEIVNHIKLSKLMVDDPQRYAFRVSQMQAGQELSQIAYLAHMDVDQSDFQKIEKNEYDMLVEAITSEVRSSFVKGVCCFSTKYNCPLLWSHYGQQHEGICIGYTAERQPAPNLQKVVYGGSRSIKTSKLCEAFLYGYNEARKEVDRDVLLRKASGWKYESEWRLIDNQGVQDSPMLMTEITFGLRCPPSVRHTVIKALEGRRNEIKFYSMYTVGNTFRLRRRLVDIEHLQSHFPVDAMSGFEIFGDGK